MPRLNGILETSLYTGDMDRARSFYEGVLRLQPMFSDGRLTAYAIERNVLLLFRKGTTEEPVKFKDGNIPGHGGTGELHVAFPIAGDELQNWLDHSASNGVQLEGRNQWSRGGESVYFRDPMATSWSVRRRACGLSTERPTRAERQRGRCRPHLKTSRRRGAYTRSEVQQMRSAVL